MVRLGLRTALVEPAALRDVDLAAENRLQSAVARVIVEDDRREHVAVLGDGERRHLQLDRLVEQLVDAAGAVEQRELGVQMKMDELETSISSAFLVPCSRFVFGVRVLSYEFRVRGSRPEHATTNIEP